MVEGAHRPGHVPLPGLKHPGRWLWLFLIVPVALGLARLHFDVEVFDLLPTNLEAVEGLKLYQQYFANARELIVTITGRDAEQTEAVARKLSDELRANSQVASVLWEPPWLEHPEQAAELMAYLWFNQPPAVFGELTNRLAPDKLTDTLAATRDELATTMSPQQIALLSYDPYGLTRLPESVAGAAPAFGQGQEGFSSADGKFRLVFVQARHELRTYRDCQEFLTLVKAAGARAAAAPALPGVRLGFTGRPAFVAEVSAGMEHDITTSVGGTAGIIAILFWLAHRRVKPMLWLLTLLACILFCTLSLGGLIYGKINVVSMGFAAILLGLAVDYAVVHYQEALAHPHLTIPQIRRVIAPSIFWAAVTTISAFLVLNFGGLPGLGQLGTLVGLGVALAATIMIFEFLPPLFPGRNQPPPSGPAASLETGGEPHPLAVAAQAPARTPRMRTVAAFAVTTVVILTTAGILAFGFPRIDTTANALRPRNSPAYAAMDRIQAELSQQHEPLWLLIGGANVEQVGQRLQQIASVLTSAKSNHLIEGFTLPTPLWPNPQFQAENRLIALRLANEGPLLRQVALTNGFAPSAVALTARVLDSWRAAAQTTGVFWPTNPMSQWIFSKFAAHTPTNDLGFGVVTPVSTNTAAVSHARLAALQAELPRHDVWLSGWELLGSAIFSRVESNFWKVLAPMVFLVMLSLYLAFRRAPEILLSLAVLLLSGACLLTIMRLVGWSWNLLDLMAIPLVLGTGVDYSIFMQLALRRHHGDLDLAYQSVGRALLLCGGTAIAGFGSLAWSSNAGMASLGQVCAVGIGSNMLIAIFLLPVWWRAVLVRAASSHPGTGGNAGPPITGPGDLPNGFALTEAPPTTPSSLYRSEFWRMGLFVVRTLPAWLCGALSRAAARVYWALAPHRRTVVINNLLPLLFDDAAAAHEKARNLFQQFALKLVDLWRYEAGLNIDDLFGPTSGWEYFLAAQAQKRGILLVTPHLGNWEFGGPLLRQRGVRLQVLTLAEPGADFTRLRQGSRARWDIETLVIGDDPFAFLDVIRRLEDGATVALLLDRPPAPSAVTVQLFGRPFAASVAAAELARASGCILLPVYLPRVNGRYEAHILPPVPYERATLRDRAARQQLTQTLISVFEPLIRQYSDQWYHFIPVWPPDSGTPGTTNGGHPEEASL
jgi:predicted exporter/lauroyl/myristoyl acyltransferase